MNINYLIKRLNTHGESWLVFRLHIFLGIILSCTIIHNKKYSYRGQPNQLPCCCCGSCIQNYFSAEKLDSIYWTVTLLLVRLYFLVPRVFQKKNIRKNKKWCTPENEVERAGEKNIQANFFRCFTQDFFLSLFLGFKIACFTWFLNFSNYTHDGLDAEGCDAIISKQNMKIYSSSAHNQNEGKYKNMNKARMEQPCQQKI